MSGIVQARIQRYVCLAIHSAGHCSSEFPKDFGEKGLGTFYKKSSSIASEDNGGMT